VRLYKTPSHQRIKSMDGAGEFVKSTYCEIQDGGQRSDSKFGNFLNISWTF